MWKKLAQLKINDSKVQLQCKFYKFTHLQKILNISFLGKNGSGWKLTTVKYKSKIFLQVNWETKILDKIIFGERNQCYWQLKTINYDYNIIFTSLQVYKKVHKFAFGENCCWLKLTIVKYNCEIFLQVHRGTEKNRHINFWERYQCYWISNDNIIHLFIHFYVLKDDKDWLTA